MPLGTEFQVNTYTYYASGRRMWQPTRAATSSSSGQSNSRMDTTTASSGSATTAPVRGRDGVPGELRIRPKTRSSGRQRWRTTVASWSSGRATVRTATTTEFRAGLRRQRHARGQRVPGQHVLLRNQDGSATSADPRREQTSRRLARAMGDAKTDDYVGIFGQGFSVDTPTATGPPPRR